MKKNYKDKLIRIYNRNLNLRILFFESYIKRRLRRMSRMLATQEELYCVGPLYSCIIDTYVNRNYNFCIKSTQLNKLIIDNINNRLGYNAIKYTAYFNDCNGGLMLELHLPT